MQTFFIYRKSDRKLLGRIDGARDWADAVIQGQAFGYHYTEIFAAKNLLPS